MKEYGTARSFIHAQESKTFLLVDYHVVYQLWLLAGHAGFQ